MILATITVVVVTAIGAAAIVGHRDGAFASSQTARIAHGTSPLDEAERILARRYATGEITAEEYNRMLVILRR